MLNFRLSFLGHFFIGAVLLPLLVGCGNITAEVGEIIPTTPPMETNPTTLKIIELDTTLLTLTEGSAAIINIAVQEKYSTATTVTVTFIDVNSRFQTVPMLVTIPANTLSVPLTLQTVDNVTYQAQQVLQLSISSPEASPILGQHLLQITLNDNDSPPASNHSPTITHSGPWFVSQGSSIALHADANTSPGIANDSDGDQLTVSSSSSTVLGIVSGNGTSTLTYSPTSTGVETLNITISDGQGGTVTTSVDIHVVTPWTWTGANSTTWSQASNWCGSVATDFSGCLGSSTAPSSTDLTVIDLTCVSGSNCNPVITSNISVAGIDLRSHTITQNAGATITLGSMGWVQTGGAFLGGNSDINNSGPFQIQAGSFRSTSAALKISATNLNLNSSASFQHNSGTIQVTAAAGTWNWPASWTLQNLSFIFPSNFTLGLGSQIYTVLGDLSVSQTACGSGYGSLNSGSFLVARNYNGSDNCTPTGSYKVTLNGSGSQSVNFASVVSGANVADLTIASSGSVGIHDSLNLVGGFTYQSGTVDLSSSRLNFSQGSGGLSIQPGNLDFNDVYFSTQGGSSSYNLGGGTMKVHGNLKLATYGCGGGIASLNNGTINFDGSTIYAGDSTVSSCGLSGSAIIQSTGVNLTLDATSPSATHQIPNFSANHSGTLTLTGTPMFIQSFTWNTGSLSAGTTTTYFSRAMSITSIPVAFYDIVIDGNGTTTLSGTLYAAHDLFFSDQTVGTSVINGGTLRVGRNLANLDTKGLSGTSSILLQALGTPATIHQNGGKFPQGNFTLSTMGVFNLLSNMTLDGASQNMTLSSGGINMSGYNLTVGNFLTLNSGTSLITNCGVLTPSSAPKLVNNGTIIAGSDVSVTVNDVTVNEGSSAVFTVSLSAASCAAVTFDYATTDATAIAGTNYTSTSGSKTIAAGNTSTTITVPTLADNYYRQGGTQTYNLILSNLSGASLVDNTGIGSITDIDSLPAVQWSASSASINETGGTITVTAQLDKPSTQSLSVNWATSDNGATSGTNYTAASGTFTFSAGQSIKTASVTILSSATACQTGLYFNVTLSSPSNATLGTTTVESIEILETDFPSLSVGNISVSEGQMAAIPVTLSAACPSTDISFTYSTGGGTAIAGSDYASVSSRSATATKGTTTALIPVTTLDNSTAEGTRTFYVTISNPSKGSISNATGTTSILDNDSSLSLATDLTEISVGGNSACALTNAGIVKCWGSNGNGSAGLGHTNIVPRPQTVTGLATTASHICVRGVAQSSGGSSSGIEDYSCALLSTGRIQCWGSNATGKLGDGTTVNKSSPTYVSNIASGATDVACGVTASGYGATCAVVSGTAKCWGYNGQGQLGNNSTTNSSVPVDVQINVSYTVLKVSVGEDHACAVVNDGSNNFIQCWGNNTYGQLGNGNNTQSLTPVTVSSSTGATSVSAGRTFTCAIINGAVQCWGRNNGYQLGNNSTTNSNIPVQATGLTTGIQQVSVGGDNQNGEYYACALNSSGQIYCWGYNVYGQGGGSSNSYTVPTQASDIGSGNQFLSTGGTTTCVVTSSGGAKCMGSTAGYEFGVDWGVTNPNLRDVSTLGGSLATINSARNTNCSITNSGASYCWGQNNSYQLGDNTNSNKGLPNQVSGLTSGVQKVVTGGDYNGFRFSCALLTDGTVKCWGNNQLGQVGQGSTATSSYGVPTSVPGLSNVIDIDAAHEAHVCVIIQGGTVKCWGRNDVGQLGNGIPASNNPSPVDVSGITNATSLALGQKYSCALLSTGAIKCWGFNGQGQLGNNSTTNSSVPVDVSGISSGATALSAYATTCAVVSGAVKCWGSGNSGQIGDNGTSQRLVPTQVTGLTSGWVETTNSWYSTCARNTEGTVKCWGNANTAGELVRGSLGSSLTAGNTVGLGAGIKAMSSGEAHHCFLTFDGYMKCAGNEASGQLGVGHTGVYTSTPTDIYFP